MIVGEWQDAGVITIQSEPTGPQVAINLARNIGHTGLILMLYDGLVPLSADGHELTEVPDSLGHFTATAAIDATKTYRAVVLKAGNVIYDGFLYPGSTTVDQPVPPAPVVIATESIAAIVSTLDKARVTLLNAVAADGKTIQIIRGDDYPDDIVLSGRTEDQWPDLTGATVMFGMKQGAFSFTKECVVTSATGIQSFQIPLSSEETATMPLTVCAAYDVQAQWDNGDETFTKTLIKGKFQVIRSIAPPG